MPEKGWKVKERQAAKFFGSERNPLSGRCGKHSASDSLHEVLFIEHKHSVNHAVVNTWKKAKTLADAEGKFPVVTLSVAGEKGLWVCCHSRDLTAIAHQREKARKIINEGG
jgi:hypothetical protein